MALRTPLFKLTLLTGSFTILEATALYKALTHIQSIHDIESRFCVYIK